MSRMLFLPERSLADTSTWSQRPSTYTRFQVWVLLLTVKQGMSAALHRNFIALA